MTEVECVHIELTMKSNTVEITLTLKIPDLRI